MRLRFICVRGLTLEEIQQVRALEAELGSLEVQISADELTFFEASNVVGPTQSKLLEQRSATAACANLAVEAEKEVGRRSESEEELAADVDRELFEWKVSAQEIERLLRRCCDECIELAEATDRRSS